MPTAKRIIVLSDGTGNAASKVWRTNVWRVFELLDLSSDEQVAKYDDGVGSSGFKPWALLAGAFGFGLKRNIIDLYKFVCRNYQPGAQIYAFGFSRGAFTVRVLVGLILDQGLVPYHSEADLHARARDAYRVFRAERFHSILRVESLFRILRDGFFHALNRLTGRPSYTKADNRPIPSIEFVGVWDTVAAYGLPIEEMTRGVSQWIWPLELPERVLSPKVRRACHAVGLDDERTTFHPVLWTEVGEPPPQRKEGEAQPEPADGRYWLKDERMSQVWFTGAHSNVGGGYPDDALAYLPLYWIMEEAQSRGLVFKAMPQADPDAFLSVSSAGDKDGRQYDSRAGLGGYYRYGPRKVVDLCNMRFSRRKDDAVYIALPKIHESALARMKSDRNAYAPIGLPGKYAIVSRDRKNKKHVCHAEDNRFETPQEAIARAGDPSTQTVGQQEKVWNLVWLRRIVYFATLAASFYLGAFWLFHNHIPEHEFTTKYRLVSEFIRFVETFLPRQVVRWWTDWWATNPEAFLLGVVALIICIAIGSNLRERITDSMRIIWKSSVHQSPIAASRAHMAAYTVRTHPAYQAIITGAKRHVLPFLSAVFLLWLGLTAGGHLLFNIADSRGLFCEETNPSETKSFSRIDQSIDVEMDFSTDAFCFPTKVRVERGRKYAIDITVEKAWKSNDSDFIAQPNGFWTSRLPPSWEMLKLYTIAPLRRVIFRPWFDLIARVGATGVNEEYLDPFWPDRTQPNVYRGVIDKAERSGEVFLYVNDAVIPLPKISDYFYRSNEGTAKIRITRLPQS
jgi:uncharacterized protein (DUF2235 family)